MSDENKAEQELKEMEQQIEQAAEVEQAKAAQDDIASSPEPETSPAPEATTTPETPVAPDPSAKPQKDPLKWAYEEKGFKSPEDMARALLQREQEYHQSRQRKEQEAPQAPPNWNPQPQYGYPPQTPPPQPDIRRLANEFGMDPEDFDKIARLNAVLTQSAIRQERARWESEISGIRRQTERQSELMQLMQDPAFRDERVQREIHAVLDSDPSIFQRERSPHVAAFHQAMTNLARKQLQQGITNGQSAPSNMPPVTAGGGAGAGGYQGPTKISPKEFERMSLKDMDATIAKLQRAERRNG